MKFAGSVIGKIFLVILCLILGMALGVGGLAGGVWLALDSMKMGKIEEMTEKFLPISFSDEVRAKTVLSYAQSVGTALGSFETGTIGELEDIIGITPEDGAGAAGEGGFLSAKLNEILGIPTEMLRASTISGLGETVGNGLSLSSVKDKFGVALPDGIPLFSDPAFLAAPLASAFEGLTDRPLSDFIKIDDESDELLRSLRDLKISELSGDARLTERIKLFIGDVVRIGDDSEQILRSLRFASIETMSVSVDKSLIVGPGAKYSSVPPAGQESLEADEYAGLYAYGDYEAMDPMPNRPADWNDAPNGAGPSAKYFVYAGGDFVKAGEFDPNEAYFAKNPVCYAKKVNDDGTLALDGSGKCILYKTKLAGEWAERKNYPLVGLNEKIANIKLGEAIKIDEGSSKVLDALKDVTIGKLGGDEGNRIIKSMFIDELMKIDENSEQIMRTLRFASIESVEERVPIDSVCEGPAVSGIDGYATEAPVGLKAFEAEGHEYLYGPAEYESVGKLAAKPVDWNHSDGSAEGSDKYCVESGGAYALAPSFSPDADYFVASAPCLAFKTKDGEKTTETVDGVESYVCYRTKLAGEGAEAKNRPLIGLNDRIGSIKLKEAVEIKPDENKVMDALKDVVITELGGAESDKIIKSMFVGDIMKIDEGSEKILRSTKYATIESVEERVPVDSVSEGPAPAGAGGYATEAPVGLKAFEAEGHEYLYGPAEYAPVGKLAAKPEDWNHSDGSAEESDKYCVESGGAYAPAPSFSPDEDYFVASAPCLAFKTKDGAKTTETVDGVESYVCYRTRLAGEGAEAKNRPLIGFNDRIGTITLGDATDIDESTATPLVKSLKDQPIAKMDKVIDRMFICEMLEVGEDSPMVLRAIRHSTLSPVREWVRKADAVESDALPDDSKAGLKAKEVEGHEYVYVKDGEEYIPYACETEPNPADPDGPRVRVESENGLCYSAFPAKSLGSGDEAKNYPMSGIGDKLDDLKLSEVFTEAELDEGILSLIEPDVRIAEIGDSVAETVKNSSIATLAGVGVIDESEFSINELFKEQRSFILNKSMNGLLGGIIDFINKPFTIEGVPPAPKPNYAIIEMESIVISESSFDSLTSFVETYCGAGRDPMPTLKLTSAATVSVSEEADKAFLRDGRYLIPAFSLEGEEGATLSFVSIHDGSEVGLAAFEGIGAEMRLAKRQFYYSFDASNGGAGSGLKYFDGSDALATLSPESNGVAIVRAVGGTSQPVPGQTFLEYPAYGSPNSDPEPTP